jgi:DNA-3-methyladenine glycosylase
MQKLTKDFFLNDSVTNVAQELLGKFLFTNINGNISSGIIVETEAYCGRDDKACHAYNGKRTKRNETMYAGGGIAYVYLCYGMHHMLNVVTNTAGQADAVLIRAVEPMEGLSYMLARKQTTKINRISSGPGNVCKALGIELIHDRLDLRGEEVWIEENISPKYFEIMASTRIGVDYAGDDAKRLWRYSIKDNKWVSRK